MSDTVLLDSSVNIRASGGAVEVKLSAPGSAVARLGGPSDEAVKLENTLVQHNIRTVAAATATVDAGDMTILVSYTSTGSVTLTLPTVAGASQHHYFIKDSAGNAGTNNITVNPADGNIDGSSSFVMNGNYMALHLVCDGSNWFVL
jgi:hypothetical protein